MISAEDCRKYAADCEEMARTAAPHDREQLLRLAREWREQAEMQEEALAQERGTHERGSQTLH